MIFTINKHVGQAHRGRFQERPQILEQKCLYTF
jgi:hypothetical protein